MLHFRRSTSNAAHTHLRATLVLLPLTCIVATIVAAGSATAQTLARPGWAGSGMRVERWWPHAVLCAMTPDSLAVEGPAGEGPALHRLSLRLEDLQTLGIDAVLLRDLESASDAQAVRSTSPGSVQLDQRYGTLEEFDALVSDATHHGIRILVELHTGAHGASLTDDARFWLNHGVTGLAIDSSQPADLRSVRGVLRGYVGERVLIGENQDTAAVPTSSAQVPPTSADSRPPRRNLANPASSRSDGEDLSQIVLPSVSAGPAAMRTAIEVTHAMLTRSGPVPLLTVAGEMSPGPSARVVATVLLGSGGAVLLRADDLDLPHATGAATEHSLFAWYRQWSGLHRGNAVMRSGDAVLLNHDADGALVWVRRSAGGGAMPIVAVCNVTDKPIRLSLTAEIQALHLRGSFLRTIARSDGGMGAMPLREVVLPPFAVYVGELSR